MKAALLDIRFSPVSTSFILTLVADVRRII
jgi:hypothetical protein